MIIFKCKKLIIPVGLGPNFSQSQNYQDKTVDSSTDIQKVYADAGYPALNSVTVNPYTLDEKTVDSSTSTQVVTSDVDGLSKVTVNPISLNPLEVNSSTDKQIYEGNHGTVTVNPYTLDSSTATITENGDYVFTSQKDGLSRVDISVNVPVPVPNLQSKSADPSTNIVTVSPDSGYDGLSSVTVNPYDIDSCYTLAESI